MGKNLETSSSMSSKNICINPSETLIAGCVVCVDDIDNGNTA